MTHPSGIRRVPTAEAVGLRAGADSDLPPRASEGGECGRRRASTGRVLLQQFKWLYARQAARASPPGVAGFDAAPGEARPTARGGRSESAPARDTTSQFGTRLICAPSCISFSSIAS